MRPTRPYVSAFLYSAARFQAYTRLRQHTSEPFAAASSGAPANRTQTGFHSWSDKPTGSNRLQVNANRVRETWSRNEAQWTIAGSGNASTMLWPCVRCDDEGWHAASMGGNVSARIAHVADSLSLLTAGTDAAPAKVSADMAEHKSQQAVFVLSEMKLLTETSIRKQEPVFFYFVCYSASKMPI